MKIVGYMVGLTPDEIELLYDALDAVNDRYEGYKDDQEEDLELGTSGETREEVAEALEKTRADLELTEKLTADFQPLIKEIRREAERSAGSAEELSRSRPRDSDRGPDRIGSVSSRKRRRGIPGD